MTSSNPSVTPTAFEYPHLTMKHLFLILVLLVVGYTVWTLSDKYARRAAMQAITRHAFRLGALVFVVLLLLAAAVKLTSTQIL